MNKKIKETILLIGAALVNSLIMYLLFKLIN